MPANSPVSVNQSPQYGDKKVLQNVAKQTKALPMSGAQAPARGPGRPVGGAQAAQSQPFAGVPPEHVSLFQRLAEADRTRQFWQQVYQDSPNQWSEMYLVDAEEAYKRLSYEVYQATPNFE